MGTGGYRYGAGRPGWRRKCEQTLRLDARVLKARNCLQPGTWFSWSWNHGGDPCGSVGITMHADSMDVRYTWTPYESEPRQMCCTIRFSRTPCNYGGTRTWFVCPDCCRRCVLVYGLNRRGRFSCRRCMNLAYLSEAEDVASRTWRKQHKLEALLSENGSRPKRMRQTTYERIWQRIEACEEARELALLPTLVRVLNRLQRC